MESTITNNRNSFIFYRSFFETIGDLNDADQLQIYRAICEFSLNAKSIDLIGFPKTIFRLIEPQLIANKARFKNGCLGAKHGVKGGRPKSKKTPKKPLANPKKTPSLTPNKNVNLNHNLNEESELKSKLESQFESFWESYIPVKTNNGFVKKGSKEKSKIAFFKALKKTSFEKIMAALQSDLNYCQQNNRFTKNVTNWLSQGDFEITDETCIIAESKKPESTQSLIFKPF